MSKKCLIIRFEFFLFGAQLNISSYILFFRYYSVFLELQDLSCRRRRCCRLRFVSIIILELGSCIIFVSILAYTTTDPARMIVAVNKATAI
uniref:Uncharacterized protein n=1 Tax=Trichogramma kaykai TaxID=54128 RepID=A0ABD2WJ73_9HYME